MHTSPEVACSVAGVTLREEQPARTNGAEIKRILSSFIFLTFRSANNLGAIGISVGSQASVMLVWELILERIFTL